MAMNWLQQMFTPQRPGPGQMAWRDKDVGEGSGEISQGDIQEMYWKRNPAKTGNRGQMMPNAVRPNPDGSGETMQTKIEDLMPAGLEPGGISAAVGPYTSGGQNQANLIGSNPDRAQMKIAEIRRQRALRDAEAARMASYTNQAPEHVSLEPFGGPGDKPDPYGGALNVADMVGQFSRSSLPSRKQPPGFWDWITGGKFN